MKHYEAPWSTSLIVMSVLTTVILPGRFGRRMVGSRSEARSPARSAGWRSCRWSSCLAAALFTIRGYSHYLGQLSWCIACYGPRRCHASGLESAEVEPDAMRGSLRTFGNGGAFSFTGFYYNKRLGSYRAYVTDPRRTVVLRYANRRVVLSPADAGRLCARPGPGQVV